MSQKDPTIVGAWIIAAGAVVLFIIPLFYMVSVILVGAGLIVLGHELEPSPSPWPNGSRTSKTMVVVGAGLILCMVMLLFAPLFGG